MKRSAGVMIRLGRGRLLGPPFTDLSEQGVAGVLPAQAGKIVQVIRRINANALMA